MCCRDVVVAWVVDEVNEVVGEGRDVRSGQQQCGRGLVMTSAAAAIHARRSSAAVRT